ncbi:MAG: M24 family metallopeptidase, partial [Myxococcota bacterium]|nr:M24 family metallopeptidase [Myxococcota bacterium]
MSENGTSTEIVEAFDHAQRDAIQLLGDVIRQLEVGMSEIDIGELAEHRAQAYGFSGWFHPPEIRFDGNLQRNHKPSHRKTLKAGTLVEVDLGPATDLAFGDVGVSLAFGQEDQPRFVQDARELCVATCGFANRGKCVGELFVFADAYARNRSMSLGDSKA